VLCVSVVIEVCNIKWNFWYLNHDASTLFNKNVSTNGFVQIDNVLFLTILVLLKYSNRTVILLLIGQARVLGSVVMLHNR